MARVLIACEESQAVTIELRNLGHEAYSCDILPCSGTHPEWHLEQDVVPLLTEVGYDHCIPSMHTSRNEWGAMVQTKTTRW
jgi:hypothetical protein